MVNRFWDPAWGRFPKAEYTVWYGMIRRCTNPSDPAFPSYGARGIGVSARWREDFMTFFADMGPRPSMGHSIDRLDNARGYEPGNCRWATRSQQQRNRRRRENAVGACYVPQRDRWTARINIQARTVYLGTFTSKKGGDGRLSRRPRERRCHQPHRDRCDAGEVKRRVSSE